MNFKAVIDFFRDNHIAQRRFERDVPADHRDTIAIMANGRLVFERYTREDVPALIFSMSSDKVTDDGHITWNSEKVTDPGVADAPKQFTNLISGAFELDGDPRLWKPV